jgi:hypothetical protein
MFSFLKPKVDADEIASGVLDSFQRRVQREDWYLPDESPFGLEVVKDECLHLHVFAFDFSTFLAFGDAPVRHAVLTPVFDASHELAQDQTGSSYAA